MISKPRLVALLKRLEWVPTEHPDIHECQCCLASRAMGHNRGCELDACLEGLAHLLPPPPEETSSR